MIKNKILLSAFAITSLLITSKAFSLNAWEGSRYIYSTSAESNKVLRIDLRQRRSGATVFLNGSRAHGIFSEGRRDKLEITFDTAALLKTPSSLVIESPITGMPIEVPAEDRIQKIVLTGSQEDLTIEEIGLTCIEFETGLEELPVVSQCVEFEREFLNTDQDFIFTAELEGLDQSLTGENIVVPISATESVFIKVGVDGTVKPVSSNASSVALASRINSLRQENGKVILDLNDESTLTLSPTSFVDGIHRVIGVKHRDNKDIELISAALTIGQKTGLENYSPVGNYKPISSNGISISNENVVSFNFNENNYGGIVSPDGESLNVWSWSYQSGVLTADIYGEWYYEENAARPLTTLMELRGCFEIPENTCMVLNKVEHQVLSINNDKITVLRTVSNKTNPQTSSLNLQNQSIMVLQKTNETIKAVNQPF